jgi:16S rRNA (guanine527-N7)-methyltransferase
MSIFLEENKKLNLSALRTPELCWPGNILDSLALLEMLPFFSPMQKILDLGTGGGFPLLPLAVCLPLISFVGLDATKKKIDAVQRIVDQLHLPNVTLICERAETAGHDKKFREAFDIVTSRAVAPISALLEYCSAFVQPKGQVILWKSMHIDEELQASFRGCAEFSCHLMTRHRYTLGGDWGDRQLLIFQKASKLSSKYPRAVGVPTKDPLI